MIPVLTKLEIFDFVSPQVEGVRKTGEIARKLTCKKSKSNRTNWKRMTKSIGMERQFYSLSTFSVCLPVEDKEKEKN